MTDSGVRGPVIGVARGDGDGPVIGVLVVDDNPVVVMGLTAVLEAAGDLRVVAVAGEGAQAIELARRHRPDLALLDVRMPGLDGVRTAGPLSALTRVLMLSYSDDPESIRASIRAGAAGYLVHGSFTPDELIRAVRDVVGGRTSPLSDQAALAVVRALQSAAGTPPPEPRAFGLSGREAEVMELVARGRSNSEIAAALVLSEKTVKNHVSRVYAKLGVRTRAAAIARWLGTAPS